MSLAAGAHQCNKSQVEALKGAVAQTVTLGSDLQSSTKCQTRQLSPNWPLCNYVLQHAVICHGSGGRDELRQAGARPM